MSDLGTDGAEPARHQRRKRSYGCLPALVSLVVIVALGMFAYVKGVDLVRSMLSGPEDYSGEGTGRVLVEVRPGDTATDIAGTLFAVDVVRSEDAFIEAAKEDPDSTSIQVGFYALRRQMSAGSALTMLLDPSARVSNTVTIPEGLRADEIASLIVKGTDFTRREVDRALRDTQALGLPAYADGVAEGYLFPSTYDVPPQSTAAELLAAMVDEFKKRAEEVDLKARAGRLGVSPHDAVIVASLVQAEARRLRDMPNVASVIDNRLAVDMLLQLDSTILYAVGSRGEINPGNLIKMDSPYNTYRVTGLPPTAIDSPGLDALEAALNPADTRFRYFVTVNLETGETKFSSRYDEFLRDKREYLKYCTTSDAC